MKILYSSGEIHTEIKKLFSKDSGDNEKFILVAYIGKKASKYIPNIRNLTIICSPTPGATAPEAIRYFLGAGVKVLFTNNLHMKVYWTEIGAIVGSANLSENALSEKTKECAVAIKSNEIDIKRLISYCNAVEVKEANLKKLDNDTDRHNVKNENIVVEKIDSFACWYKSIFRRDWKIGIWTDTADFSLEANEISRLEYRVKKPYDYLGVSKNQVCEGEWILSLNLTDVDTASWIYVDFIANINRDEDIYDTDFPNQAIQVQENKYYPKPPFNTNEKKFKNALRSAISRYGTGELENQENLIPNPKFIDILFNEYYGTKKL